MRGSPLPAGRVDVSAMGSGHNIPASAGATKSRGIPLMIQDAVVHSMRMRHGVSFCSIRSFDCATLESVAWPVDGYRSRLLAVEQASVFDCVPKVDETNGIHSCTGPGDYQFPRDSV